MAMGFEGLVPELASRLQAMIAAAAQAGYTITPGSGKRTRAEQEALYRAYKNGTGNLAAVPGTSHHEFGLAMDLNYGSDEAARWAQQNAGRFGIGFPVKGENWHAEMIGDQAAGYYQGASQMGAYGFNLNWMDKPVSPEERQDSLISSYMDAMTGAHQDALLESPDASEVSSPELAQDFSTEAPARQTLRQDVTTLPGGAQGQGGTFEGNVPPPGFNPAGEGPERWRSTLAAALQYAGVTPTPELLDLGIRRIGQESGGNPMAVNDWDSNAQRGDPSKGLLQNIGSAFADRARELAGRGIFDGFASMVASIRYTLANYGSLEAGWGRKGGY